MIDRLSPCVAASASRAAAFTPRPLVAAIALLCASTANAETLQMDTLQIEDDRLNATAVIDSEEIALHQAHDLKDVFRDTPSVTVGGTTASSEMIYVRGLEDTNLNISVDGASQNGYLFHHSSSFNIEPELLKRAEVQAGPGAADNGPNALGGSIKFVTKDAQDLLEPGETFGGMVKGSTESAADAVKGTLSVYGEVAPNAGLLFSTSARNSDDYRTGGGDEEEGTGGHQRSYFGKFSLLDQGAHSLRISAEHNEDSGIYCTRPNMECQPFNNVKVDTELSRDTYTANYDYEPGSRLVDVHTNVFHTKTELDRTTVSTGDKLNADVESYGGDLNNTFRFGPEDMNNRLTLGSDYVYDESSTGSFDEKARNLALYAQHRMTLGAVDLSFGARVDDYKTEYANGETLDDTDVSPNASLNWRVGGGVELFTGYSTAVRGNKGREAILADDGVGVGETLTVEPGLEAETSRSTEVGARWKGNDLLTQRDRAGLEVTYFDTHFDNYITDETVGSETTIYNMEGIVTSKGVEARATYGIGGWDMTLGYLTMDLEDNQGETVVDDMGLGNQTGDRWSLDNRYTFVDPQMTIGWTVTAYERLTDLPDDQSERAGYATHDVYASWVPRDMQDLTLTAGIYNLFDKEYTDQNTYFLEPNDRRGITTGAITSPGRDVRLSVAYRF
ncbi:MULTISPECIES: TonB-dependent receptor domain-containing protein [unclassified Cobetia]|uniref:TonB-dependent receptor domain-containing protein n=1 Tax=unclassified Cobetia TaxID=2609414 RepID=UPI00178CAD3B|nr:MULTISPECIES: TonB-dependent receptor [unclassified Cobetia]MBE2167360.1 TonB-dependent receptor [Cobetia sp. 2AS1]MDH2447196.1 TonB-dependent receptor [Cobetia sp. 2AS]